MSLLYLDFGVGCCWMLCVIYIWLAQFSVFEHCATAHFKRINTVDWHTAMHGIST